MSTIEILKEHVQNGNLIQFVPTDFFGVLPQRGLYMPDGLHNMLHQESTDIKDNQDLPFIKARLAIFVNGKKIDNFYYMKRLQKAPFDIWEIRVKDMLPQYRVFGMFAYIDTFICSHIVRRDQLGGFNSKEWDQAKVLAHAYWCSLFPGISRHTGNHFSDYIESNGNHYDWNYK